MSGIVGIYYLNGQPATAETLGQMVDTLAHRGPDGAEIWYQGSTGLGHRMLWTTPESLLERLPLANSTGDLVLTADARIDNRDDLIAALDLRDQPAEKITDAQLILAAYEQWGQQCPSRLIGDFAFAIWDRHQQHLFCARDPFGIKPFYYYRSDSVFVFASEIKALHCLADVPRRLNELRVAYHLIQCFEDETITFYQDIWRLPAAHSLTVSHRDTQPQLYWALDPAKELHLGSHQEYVAAFRETFVEAVRCRVRSAFPIGSSLSGGLDSSSIACTAQQLLKNTDQQPLHTFSAVFPSLPEADRRWIDEREYMQAVKDLGGFQSHDIHADQLNPLIDILWQADEAILAPNLYIHQAMYNQAQDHGVRIFLDGFDGDTTVSYGIGYLSELLLSGQWHRLLQEGTTLARRYRLPRRRVLWQYCLNPTLGKLMGHITWRLGGNLQRGQANSSLINATFAKASQVQAQRQKLLSKRHILPLTSRQEHWLGLTNRLNLQILDIADKVTARSSLEARYPFFDRRLAELCLAIPAEYKLRQGWMRYILRAAMTGVLPKKVQWRLCKGDLSSNFNQQISDHEKTTLTGIFSHPQTVEPYLNLSTLQTSYQRYFASAKHSEHDRISLFSAAVLKLWLQHSNLV